MNELQNSFSSSLAMGWAYLWRSILVTSPWLILMHYVEKPTTPGYMILFGLAQAAVGLVSTALAMQWLRARGFGSIKIILVEWAEYQRFKADSHSEHTK